MKNFIQNKLQILIQFFSNDMWELDIYSLKGIKRQLIRGLRVIHLVLKGFKDDELFLRASALTFTALLSLAPLLAFMFTVVKMYVNEDEIILKINAYMQEMPTQFQDFVHRLTTSVMDNSYGSMGIIGLIVVLFIIIQMLSSIEATFNRIWGVSEQRSMFRKFTDYTSTIVVVPIAMLGASAMNAMLRDGPWKQHLGNAVVAYEFLFKFSGLFMAVCALSFLYRFIPNTRVRTYAAISGGLIAALLWFGWQEIYYWSQAGVATYSKVFGAFAAVPIFMAWLFISWVIILFGAEFSFAMQNNTTYVMEKKAISASAHSRIRLSLALMQETAKSMLHSLPPFSIQRFARKKNVPTRLLNDVAHQLKKSGFLAEIYDEEQTFVLARPSENILLHDIIEAMLNHGSRPKELGLARQDVDIEDIIDRVKKGLEVKLDEMTLKDLVST